MPRRKKSGQLEAEVEAYRVVPSVGTLDDLVEPLRRFATTGGKSLYVSTRAGDVLVSEPAWHHCAGTEIFSASAFRSRRTGHPVVLGAAGARSLTIGEDEDVGEPTCFAVDPAAGKAVVLMNFGAPRPTVIAGLLKDLGVPGRVQVTPMVYPAVLQQLAEMERVVAARIGFVDLSLRHDLGKVDPSVAQMIAINEEMNAKELVLQLKVDNDESLAYDRVYQVAEGLLEEGIKNLKVLKVWGYGADETRRIPLDLLGGSIRMSLDVPMNPNGKEIDRPACQNELVRCLTEVLPGIEIQGIS